MASSYAYPRASHAENGHASSEARERLLSEFLGNGADDELPLYKDKPRYSSRQKRMLNNLFARGRWKRWLMLATAAFTIWWFAASVIAWLSRSEISWSFRQNMVREAFILSWEDYAKNAWGKDNYSPISRESSFIVNKIGSGVSTNAGVGWIIVDGLDTAIMMNCTSQVAQARKWIQTSLDFGKLDGDINTFETTIRVLGGLLSAHYLSTTFPHLAPQRDDDKGQKGEDLYVEKAVDLAERLLGAFNTPTGIPWASINLNTSDGIPSHEISGASSVAEAATLQLELKYVAKITGEPLYWTVAEKVIAAIDARRSENGLVPIFIDPVTGFFHTEEIRLGSRGDSYYEYLIKQYLQTGETIYKDMWDEVLDGIKRHLITWSRTADFTVLAERPQGLSREWNPKMDHLTCFLPGSIALGVTGGLSVSEAKAKLGSAWGRQQEEDLILAEELMKTCWGMYVVTPTGLAPEITYLKIDDPPRRWDFDDPKWRQPRSRPDFEHLNSAAYQKNAAWHGDYDIHAQDVHNLQRPETVESLYYLWRITGKQIYREWGWRMFKSFQQYTIVINTAGKASGYTSLASVMDVPPKHLDNLVVGMNVAQAFADKLHFSHDNMEGFWLAETLKYFYLLFSDEIPDEWFDLSKVVINTEAHFFPRFNVTGHNVFKTGWARKPKPPRA